MLAHEIEFIFVCVFSVFLLLLFIYIRGELEQGCEKIKKRKSNESAAEHICGQRLGAAKEILPHVGFRGAQIHHVSAPKLRVL